MSKQFTSKILVQDIGAVMVVKSLSSWNRISGCHIIQRIFKKNNLISKPNCFDQYINFLHLLELVPHGNSAHLTNGRNK